MRTLLNLFLAALLFVGLGFAGDRDRGRRFDRDSYRSYDRNDRDYRHKKYNSRQFNRGYAYRDYYNLPPGIAKNQWRQEQYRRQMRNQRNRWSPWW